MSNAAVLTAWAVTNRRSTEDIMWDLLVLPQLFGPVTILDNMLIDNKGLVEALSYDGFRALMQSQVNHGLVSLAVRGSHAGARSIEDLLMIWLSRGEKGPLRTVGLASLSDHANEGLRAAISRGVGSSVAARCREFAQFVENDPSGVRGYTGFLQEANALFFGATPRLLPFHRMPSETIQERFFRSIGLEELARMSRSGMTPSPSDISRAISASGLEPSPALLRPGVDWKPFFDAGSQETGPVVEVFRELIQRKDFGRGRCIAVLEAFDGGFEAHGETLRHVLNATYAAGIPEVNDWSVLWPAVGDSTRTKHDLTIAELNQLAHEVARSLNQIEPGAWRSPDRRGRVAVEELRARLIQQDTLGLTAGPRATARPVESFVGQGLGLVSSILFAEALGAGLPTVFSIVVAAAATGPTVDAFRIALGRVAGRSGTVGRFGANFCRQAMYLHDVVEKVDARLAIPESGGVISWPTR